MKHSFKNTFSAVVTILGVLSLAISAFAHVVVTPSQAGIGSFQTFSVSVPNEKDTLVTEIRLLIPSGLSSVSPTVKPGWTITEKKTGEGDSAVISEIDWTGGVIPSGQRDDFTFSAQVPASPTTLSWKAYQTYSDGTVVTWDQNPKGVTDDEREKMESEGKGPYSETKIVNDLTVNTTQSAADQTKSTQDKTEYFSLILSIVAIALSAVALQKKS